MADCLEQFELWLKNNDSLLNKLLPLLPSGAESVHVEQLRNTIDTFFRCCLCDEIVFGKSIKPAMTELFESANSIENILDKHEEVLTVLISEILKEDNEQDIYPQLKKTLCDAKHLCSMLAKASLLLCNQWDKRKPGRPESKCRNIYIDDLTKIFIRAGGHAKLITNTEKTEYSGPYYSYISEACALVGDKFDTGQALAKSVSRHVK